MTVPRISLSRRGAVFALATAPWLAHAQRDANAPLRVLLSDRTSSVPLVAAVRARYARVAIATEIAAFPADASGAPLLAVGARALAHALDAAPRAPTVALATREFYRETTAATVNHPWLTGIFTLPSIAVQLRVTARLLGRPGRILVPVLGDGAAIEAELRASNPASFEIAVLRVAADENIARALARSDPFDAVVALPQPELYTPLAFRALLEATYRRGKPVIGFNDTSVAAGAVIAPYSAVDDLLDHFDELLPTVGRAPAPPPTFPKYWRVSVNDNVARSLGIPVTAALRALGASKNRRP